MEVEYIIEPGVGASPALLDNMVTLPFDNLRKGVANDNS